METTVQRLRYVLDVLAPAVGGKKATLPILQNVVVGQGKAWALNLETAVTVEFPEATDEPVLLPHQQLLSMLKNIPGPTRLTINREGEVIKLAAGATSADFPVPGEVAEFPPLPKLQPVGEGQVDGDLFLKTATALAEYAATDVSRPVLQCVCVTLGAPLAMVAGDGFCLAWQTLPMKLAAPDGMTQILLPTTGVHTLARVWKVMEKIPSVVGPPSADPTKPDGEFRMAQLAVAKRMARISLAPGRLSFEHGSVEVRLQCASGEFPNYRQLIPTDLPNKVSFDAEEALRALRSLQDVAADGSGIVRLTWSDGTLGLSASAEETWTISASVRAHIQGKEARIAFNIKYLLGYLHGKMGTVLLETAAPSSPGRFFCSGSPDVLIMPLYVKWGDEPATEPTDASPSAEEAPVDAPPGAEAEGAPVSTNGKPAEVPAAAKPRARRKAKG